MAAIRGESGQLTERNGIQLSSGLRNDEPGEDKEAKAPMTASQQHQQPTPKRKLSRQDIAAIVRFWLQFIRAGKDPKAFEQAVDQLTQQSGIPAQDMPVVRHAFQAVRDVKAQDRRVELIDRWLVGGTGVVDLILLQVILSNGKPDAPLAFALHLLVLSLPLVALSLFFSFLKQQFTIPMYGRIHSNLTFFALLTGTLSLDGAIWHLSSGDSILFLVLAVLAYLWAAVYLFLVRASFRFLDLQKQAETEQETGRKKAHE